jgi:isoquinoline 1-oxidoreductase
LLIFALSDSSEGQESGGGRRRQGGGGTPQTIDAWLHIADNGAVTVFTGKVEVGQNSRTALTQAVAEELRTPVAAITLVMGDTALTPYDMGTFGSQTTPRMAPMLRRAAAAARQQLIEIAAKLWQVDPATLAAADGKITLAGSHKSAGYGELVKGQNLSQSIGAQVAVTPAAEWKVAGTSVSKVDGRAFVTGSHRYSSDIKRDGMLFGKVLRSPAIDASLTSVDITAAAARTGVTAVKDKEFVGVAAKTQLEAEHALAAIKAEWSVRSTASDSKALFDSIRPTKTVAVPGTVQSSYTVAYIAHAPLEPRSAVAEWNGDKLTVWTGTQRPFGVRQELAAAFQIPETQVHVIMPDTGSGYGGKHTGEAAIEAARLARAAGKPVKLVWTREEEFSWAYFRPAGVIDITAAVSGDGIITAWEMDNYNSGGSAIGSPYNIPGQRCEFHQTKYPLRQGSYRGLAGTANHFARESQMDDLARKCKLDPLDFRLKNCRDERLAAVINAATKSFGWRERKSKVGIGFGMAAGNEKGGYIANCVEIGVDSATTQVKVLRAIAAFECGAVVNPAHLQNQIEGAIVMGIGGALFEAVKFEEGKFLNPHFASYRLPRFEDAPSIEVVLVNRKDLPSAGAGETPIMAIAPAIRNAILDATGVALYSMPLAPEGVKRG